MTTHVRQLAPVLALGLVAAFSSTAFAEPTTATWRNIETYAGAPHPAETTAEQSAARTYTAQPWQSIEIAYSLADPAEEATEAGLGQAGPAGPSIVDGRHIWSPINIELTNTLADPDGWP